MCFSRIKIHLCSGSPQAYCKTETERGFAGRPASDYSMLSSVFSLQVAFTLLKPGTLSTRPFKLWVGGDMTSQRAGRQVALQRETAVSVLPAIISNQPFRPRHKQSTQQPSQWQPGFPARVTHSAPPQIHLSALMKWRQRGSGPDDRALEWLSNHWGSDEVQRLMLVA